jgi:uncharacterized protein
MGMVLILCTLAGLFSRSAQGGQDSHTILESPATPAAPADPAGATAIQAILNGLVFAIAILAPIILIILWRRDVIRPGSLVRRGVRDVRGWPWWFWFMAAFVAFLAAGIGAGVAGDVARAMGADPAGLSVKAAASMGGAILGIGAAMALVLLMDTRSTHRSGLELSLGRRDVRLGLLALVLAMPVVQATSILSVVLYQVMTGSSPAPIAHETLSALHREPGNPAVWILIAGAVLGAPVLEELVFRIFLQSSILRLTRRPWIAILITSVVFTAAHMGDEAVSAANWHALLSLFVLSVALGHSYEWTRRPAVPILLHMGFNAFNVALVVLGAV